MKLYTIKICISKFNKFKIVNNKNPDSFQACKPRNIKNKANRAKNHLKSLYISKKIVKKKINALRTYFKIFLHSPRHLNYILAQMQILFK